MECEWAKSCSGCPEIENSYQVQLEHKVRRLESLLKENDVKFGSIDIISAGESKLRDRVDATIRAENNEQRIGFYNSQKELIDIPHCEQLSPKLSDFFKDFRKISWGLQKGSFRLRVSPNGDRGAWLDFSNVDIKRLLDEQTTLRELLKMARVEIGQKRKVLSEKGSLLKLIDPDPAPWFWTYSAKTGKPIDLFCNVGGFTQPSFGANKVLVNHAFSKITSADVALEYGSGCGNFTLPLAEISNSVLAIETDDLSVAALKINLQKVGLSEKVRHHRNFSPDVLADMKVELALVDPPRSGCGKFIDDILETILPRQLVYVSCGPEAFAKESLKLQRSYEIESLTIIDQFPQSSHYEIVAHFKSKA